uniref:AlNc14C321G10591 protein n=1 Tax=Albugo laibachii Nc14 TaxID=890382 RepID=F0WWF7_9STRA|nr:AlNc14C321G10591 [Albugo laibachii Nc14]|eukprot:CCA25780.1 AlNc14C321G10591 [Albugo laibachii Nc14]
MDCDSSNGMDATIQQFRTLKLQSERQCEPMSSHLLRKSISCTRQSPSGIRKSTLEQEQESHRECAQHLRDEYESTYKQHFDAMQKEVVALHNSLMFERQQNRLLRAAVCEKAMLEEQIKDQNSIIASLQEQVQQARLSSYRLQLMLQQSEREFAQNEAFPPPPPDIF